MKLSVVIPVYNEEKTVEDIVNAVRRELDQLPMVDDYELVLVEDGSTDSTRVVIRERIEPLPKVRVFYQPHNQGKGAALARGFAETTGDIVLVQDADLEYSPSDYTKILTPFQDGVADVVYGSRFKGGTARVLFFWHYVGNKFLTLLSNMFTNLNLTDMETCYKAFRGDVIRNMVLTSKRFGIEPEMTAKLAKIRGVRVYEVTISYFGRTYEEGKKIGWRDGISAIWSIVRFNVFCTYSSSFKATRHEAFAPAEVAPIER